MARKTTKPNAAITTKPQRSAGIRLADGSKLVGVLFGSDMTTVLAFVIQDVNGGNSIETVADFAKKVRISDYVDAYGRCVPKKLREFQARDGHNLPYSRVLRSDSVLKVKPDPKTITVEVINQLLSACAFAPLPDYVMVEKTIRRASTKADEQTGKCTDGEGLMGLALLLHYPDMKRKKKVKDASGNVKVVPTVVKEHTVKKFLPAYDVYSLPFEVKKYAVKRTAVKTAIGATTPLYNYYVSIKKDGLALCNSNSPSQVEKSTMLLKKETSDKYNPAYDPELVQAMFMQQNDIDDFRKNGVFIKGAGAAAPVSAIKAEFTTADLFDFDSEEESTTPIAVDETLPTLPSPDEDAPVGDAPVDEGSAEEVVAAVGSDELAGGASEDISGIFAGVTILDAPVVGGDGDLSTPTDRGVTLPSTVMAPGLFDANSAKILAEARSRWDALCAKMRAAADAICDGVDYSYGGKTKKLPEPPKAFEGHQRLIYEDLGARHAELVFGDTKKGSKYPLLTLNSINVKLYRKFYAAFMDKVENIPVESNLSYDTITLYAFDGKPKGDDGFGITLPSGEHFTSSDIHKELKEISELMHSLDDDAVQVNLTRTFLNAGLAATWRQAIKEKRKELGLNTTAVAKSESMASRIDRLIVENYSEKEQEGLRQILLPMAFGNSSIASYKSNLIPYDPVTSEYRGKGSTYSEWELGKTVARAIDDMKAQDANTADYKASTSKKVQGYIEALRSREGGTPWDDDKRLDAIAEMAAKDEVAELKASVEVPNGFDWDAYEKLKAYTVAEAGKSQIGNSQPTKSSSSDYALSFDMHLGAEDIEGMQASGIELSEESPVLVNAAAKLDSNVQAMILWLLATVGVGENTNDGLQFTSDDSATPGLWTDKSKAARAGASTRTRTFEYVANTPDGKAVTFGASLKQPV